MSTKARIYVADPDPGVVQFVRGTLEPAGFSVQEALDFSQIPDELRTFDADVALISTGIEGHYYGDIIRDIKRSEFDLEVVVITMIEDGDRRLVGDSLAQGAADVIHKPMVAADLTNRVQLHTRKPGWRTTDLELSELSIGTESRMPVSSLKTGSERYDSDLTTFIEISEAIASSLDPEDVYYVLVRRIADAVDCDRCNVVLRGIGDSEAFVVASHEDPNLRRLAIALERYPEYRLALDSMEPVLIDDAQLHPVTEKVRGEVEIIQLGAILVFPLIVRETAVGVMSISTRGRAREFEPAELLLLRAMANLAACVVKSTTALESLRYQSAAAKAPAEEFDNIVLDLDDQIELLIDEFEKGGR